MTEETKEFNNNVWFIEYDIAEAGDANRSAQFKNRCICQYSITAGDYETPH